MIDITPYQIVVPLFSVVMMAYAWNLVMRQKKTIWEASLWTVFWLLVAIAALFPGSLKYLSDLTGIKKNENAAVFTSIGLLFFALFYIIIRIEALEQRFVKVVRNRALEDAKIDNANGKLKIDN